MEFFGIKPGRQVAIYFVIAILIGTALLLLPVSSKNQPIEFINALFTATSAICVTGLTVLDTGKDFSLFGQIVILLLIQLGGIGIMTFTTAILVSIGSKLSFHDKYGLSQSLSTGTRTPTKSLLKAVVITTLSFELIGALFLFFKFRTQFSFGHAVFNAIFHAVSAFCNAGFSTFSNSLENYRFDPFIIIVFSLLIISGGLGFAVIRELITKIKHKEIKLSLHSKLCLTTTAALLIIGTVAFYGAESSNLFKNTDIGYNISNAFFQAVTCRTAGFNTLSQIHLTDVSILLSMILMFIGACPGSTGGGTKTTTFAIIFLLVYNRFFGRRSVTAFKRSITNDSISRAATILLSAIMIIVIMFVLLLFSEEIPAAFSLGHGWFVSSLFEVISAFGTVGLSMGVTPYLHYLGKIIIIILMFTGRVGLLTLAFALARPPKQGEIVYLEEGVMVG